MTLTYKGMVDQNFEQGKHMVSANAERDSGAWAVFDLKRLDTREHRLPWEEISYEDGACPVRETIEHGWDNPTHTVLAELGRVEHTWIITETLYWGSPITGEMWSLLVEFEDGHLEFFDSRYFNVSAGNVPRKARQTNQEMTLF